MIRNLYLVACPLAVTLLAALLLFMALRDYRQKGEITYLGALMVVFSLIIAQFAAKVWLAFAAYLWGVLAQWAAT